MKFEEFLHFLAFFLIGFIVALVLIDLVDKQPSAPLEPKRSPLLDLTEVIRPEPGIVCVVAKVSVNYSISCLKEEKVLEQL